MNRKSTARRRTAARRRDSVAARREGAKAADRPANVIDLPNPPRVERGHVVPAFYQRRWGRDGLIAVHDLSGQCRSLSINRRSGVRGPYYRRVRPGTGEETDDVEASLSVLEGKAAPALREVVDRGADFGGERKAVLASLFAAQLLRGPAHFSQREIRLRAFVSELTAADFRAGAVKDAGGDVAIAQARLLEALLDPTYRFTEMLRQTNRLATLLVNMRWHLLEFRALSLSTSDHPVVVWPLEVTSADPFPEPFAGPLGALEVRVALSPSLALLMTWSDGPDEDRRGSFASDRAARELNAFSASQAEQEWMHHLDAEPARQVGPCPPLSRVIDPAYGASVAVRSTGHAFATRWYHETRDRKFVNELTILRR